MMKYFLKGLSIIYLFAFISFYFQADGLYGDNGIIPIGNRFESFEADDFKTSELIHRILRKPNLLLYRKYGGVDDMLDLLCIIGSTASCAIFWGHSHFVILFIQFISYLSIYSSGPTFMSFQWDILLLEVGFVSIFLGYYLPPSHQQREKRPVIFWLRVIAFKLLFMAGLVKLSSHCPTWNTLTALEYHFASQCIPTPLGFNI